jgi:hypothetical protein
MPGDDDDAIHRARLEARDSDELAAKDRQERRRIFMAKKDMFWRDLRIALDTRVARYNAKAEDKAKAQVQVVPGNAFSVQAHPGRALSKVDIVLHADPQIIRTTWTGEDVPDERDDSIEVRDSGLVVNGHNATTLANELLVPFFKSIRY